MYMPARVGEGGSVLLLLLLGVQRCSCYLPITPARAGDGGSLLLLVANDQHEGPLGAYHSRGVRGLPASSLYMVGPIGGD